MKINFFWNEWDKSTKRIYQVLLVILIVAVLAYAIAYIMGSSFIIGWEMENIIKAVPTIWDSYWIGMYEFPIIVDNYLISQNFSATNLIVNVWPAYLLMGWMAVFLSLVLALMPKLSRFWFVVSVVLFTLLLVGLKLEYLMLFDSYEKYGIAIGMVLYFPLLYLFHFIKPDTSFLARIASFLGATVVFAIIIYKFSQVPLPFLHLANYGIYVPLILTVFFCFMVGHEIVSGLLGIISGGGLTGEKGGLYHFLIVSVVFLVNVALLLFKNARIIDGNLYLIGAFALLTVATVIGIWGYRQRENTYEGTFSFYPTGAFLYLGLAITAHVTIAYFFVTGNDSLVEAVEDAIVFSQLGFSGMFVVYFLANFYDMMRENADVAKVVYKPRRMPYFTSRFAALIVVLGIFLRLHMTPYNQAVAGFYAGVGDLYLKAGDMAAAREYYNLTNTFSSTGHRGNYAMATLEHELANTSEEIRYLKKANTKNPTPFSTALLASRLSDEKKYFEALFILKDGIAEFPEEGRLMNNLGLLYTEIGQADSAFIAFDQALQKRKSADAASANAYALMKQQQLEVREDTLPELLNSTIYLPAINNLVVLANAKRQAIDDRGQVSFKDPKSTTIDQVLYNYNKTLNNPDFADSAYNDGMNLFYDSAKITWFEDQVRFAAALASFKQGNINQAMHILNGLAIQNPEKEYFPTLGKLALSLRSWDLAIDHFKNSIQNGQVQVAPQLAFAYMEAGQHDKAAFIWRQIQASGDTLDSSIAEQMIRILEMKSVDDVLFSSATEKLSFIRYRFQIAEPEKLEALALSIDNQNIRALALLKIFDVYMELSRFSEAAAILENLGELSLSEQRIVTDIDLAQCRFAYYSKNPDIMKRLAEQMAGSSSEVNAWLALFRIMPKINTQPDSNIENELISMTLRNPFFTAAVIETTLYLNGVALKPELAYEAILKAVRTNPFDDELNKLYAMQCLKMGLREYALKARDELRLSLSSQAFQVFNSQFEKELQLYEARLENWQ